MRNGILLSVGGLSAVAAIAAIATWLSDAPPDRAGDLRVAPVAAVPAIPAPSPTAATKPLLDGARLLEIETAGEEDLGGAAVQLADGTVTRLRVRGWLDPVTRLLEVYDTRAVFESAGRRVTLLVEDAPAAPADAGGLPGIDFDKAQGKANPAMARR